METKNKDEDKGEVCCGSCRNSSMEAEILSKYPINITTTDEFGQVNCNS